MLGALRKGIVNSTIGLKSLFSSSKSKVYVKDLRKPVMYNDGRLLRYPKNYDKVEKYEIQQEKDLQGKIICNLAYGKEDKIRLLLVTEDEKSGKYYFTVDYLIKPKHEHYEVYYKPFGFIQADLKKYLPVFEAVKEDGSYRLVKSSILNEKGRNAKLLYTSHYKPLDINFFEIRDKHKNLELSTSFISVPIVLVGPLAKIAAKVLIFLPEKLGEYLISKQNLVAKCVGQCLFVPAAAVKNLVNMGTVVLKLPILWLTRSRKDFGSMYSTALKSQWNECWKEIKSDFEFIKNSKRVEVPEEEEKKEKQFFGTWKELNCIRKQEKVEEGEKPENKSLASIEEVKVNQAQNNTQIENKKPGEHTEKLRLSKKNTTEFNVPSR